MKFGSYSTKFEFSLLYQPLIGIAVYKYRSTGSSRQWKINFLYNFLSVCSKKICGTRNFNFFHLKISLAKKKKKHVKKETLVFLYLLHFGHFS